MQHHSEDPVEKHTAHWAEYEITRQQKKAEAVQLAQDAEVHMRGIKALHVGIELRLFPWGSGTQRQWYSMVPGAQELVASAWTQQ
jgi:hypothetical protein